MESQQNASDIFSRLIQNMSDKDILRTDAIGSNFVSPEDLERVKEFINNPKKNEGLLRLLEREGRVFGVVHAVNPETDHSGTINYFDQSGFPMGFGYDFQRNPDMYPGISSFEVGDIILLEMNGLERKKVTKLPLANEDRANLLAYIKSQSDSLNK